nr:MAG TPA: hypothetical protein [Caudoviricetes sp.]
MFYLTYEYKNCLGLFLGSSFFIQKSIINYTKVLYMIPKCDIIVL